jgi:MraZ protein
MADEVEAGIALEALGAATPALPAYGHAPFHGTYRLKLDGTGRVALPAALKGAFADRALVRAFRDRYLMVWTPLGFEAVVDKLVEANPTGLVDPRTRKRFHIGTSDVSVDKQSRFVIPPDLRTQVGLGERIVLAGSIETIEIWSAEAFEAEQATLDDVDLFFDGFEGL